MVKISNISLTLACGDYDLNRGLIDGTIKPEGIDLTAITLSSPERHWRMSRFKEFDICEYSMSFYLVARTRKEPFMAIPAFPHRRFRHSYIFINANAGIKEPQNLMGKKVGLRTYENTAGLWARGILQHNYGVDLKKIQWINQDEEDFEFTPPRWLKIQRVSSGKNVSSMLAEGEIQAAIYPEIISCFANGDPRVKRLFNDYKKEEVEYYKKTHIFPIMHTVIIKEEILKKYPWVAVSMLKALRQSKDLCYRRLEDPRKIALAWIMNLKEEERKLLGKDPWAYNLVDNKHNLETLIQYSYEQGLINRKLKIEELFVEAALEELPKYV